MPALDPALGALLREVEQPHTERMSNSSAVLVLDPTNESEGVGDASAPGASPGNHTRLGRWWLMGGVVLALIGLGLVIASGSGRWPFGPHFGALQGNTRAFIGPGAMPNPGVPVTDSSIRIASADGILVSTTRTDASGAYRIREQVGTYLVSVSCGEGWWSRPVGVKVTNGVVTTAPDLLCLGV